MPIGRDYYEPQDIVTLGGASTGVPTVFNVKDTAYGATGDGVTNDTTAINAAISAANSAGGGIVHFPKGTYLANGIVIPGSNILLRGTGWGSVIKQVAAVADNTYLISCFGTGITVASNKLNIGLADLQLLGRCDTDTFTQYVHLFEISGVSDCVVERCFFNKWRGDAIIVASNQNGGTQVERHNARLTIRNCKFDGGNFNNRNGITLQDITDCTIENNYFTNCTFTGMPGAIDIEPNSVAYTQLRDIKIIGNKFDAVAGAAGVVGMNLTSTQASLTTPVSGLTIEGNQFRNCTNTTGPIFLRQQQTPADSTERNEVFIVSNKMWDNAGVPVELEGLRGVRMERNYFARSQSAFALGSLNLCMDVTLAWSTLYQVGLSEGTAVGIYNVTRLDIVNNVFDAIGDQAGTGRLTAFNGTATSSKIRFIGNRVIGFASTASAKGGSHTLSVDTNEWYANDTSMIPSTAHWSQNTQTQGQQVIAITYATTMTPDASLGQYQKITPTDTVAMTIGAPTNPSTGLVLVFDFLNSSGGTMGVVTWNAVFKLAGAFTNPASTKRRTITFRYDGTSWVEQYRVAADI